MNYSELATILLHLGERLSKHAAKIEGELMGRSAQSLAVHLAKFEETLSAYLAGRKSGEILLETILRSPAAKRHLTMDLLRKGLRELTGKRLKSDELRGAKKEFVERVHEAEQEKEAAKYLKGAFADAIHSESSGKDKASLQREFIGLGQLADEEFPRVIEKKSVGELRRLAAMNGIRFTDKTTRQRLAALIRRYAQRAVFNISAGA